MTSAPLGSTPDRRETPAADLMSSVVGSLLSADSGRTRQYPTGLPDLLPDQGVETGTYPQEAVAMPQRRPCDRRRRQARILWVLLATIALTSIALNVYMLHRNTIRVIPSDPSPVVTPSREDEDAWITT